jgi:hypothetical protein
MVEASVPVSAGCAVYDVADEDLQTRPIVPKQLELTKQKMTQAKVIQMMAMAATGLDARPRYHGPGMNSPSLANRRQAIGIPYAQSAKSRQVTYTVVSVKEC